jgi:hypothetical protein
MSRTLDETFVEWLYAQVADPSELDPSKTHYKLFWVLYSTEFYSVLGMDENRVSDALELRGRFSSEEGLSRVTTGVTMTELRDWAQMPCSFLELLVGLSNILSFETGDEPRRWFWQLLDNLKISGYSDARPVPEHHIRRICQRVIDREYAFNGVGGLFPLIRPNRNQREVELWYQASAYIMENTL